MRPTMAHVPDAIRMVLCVAAQRLFKYAQKGCKNQIVTAGRLLAVLDMRPSTTINGAALLTAPSTSTLVQGPYLIPTKITNKPRHLLTPPWACS